jgi:hypothetical protein
LHLSHHFTAGLARSLARRAPGEHRDRRWKSQSPWLSCNGMSTRNIGESMSDDDKNRVSNSNDLVTIYNTVTSNQAALIKSDNIPPL